MNFLASITRIFNVYGYRQTITTAGADRQVTALVVPMDSGTVGVFFDGNESVGLTKPALTLYVAGSEPNPPRSNDVFFYADLDASRGVMIVRKVYAFRIAGMVLVYECLCD